MTSKTPAPHDRDEFELEVDTDPGSQTEVVAHELSVTVTGFNAPRYVPECSCGWADVGYTSASSADDAWEGHL